MNNSIHSAETVYVGYSLAERQNQAQAWSEALADLATLRAEWIRRSARAKRASDRARLEAAVTQVAASLAKRATPRQGVEQGREYPFLLTRRAANKVVTGVRRRPMISLFMSQVAGLTA